MEASARKAEHGYRHTAIIHTCHLGHVTEMARVMNTTLFVHNGPVHRGPRARAAPAI